MTRLPTPEILEGMAFDPSKIIDGTVPVEKLDIWKIRRDGGTQPRAETDSQTVADYAQAMASGSTFPPVTVFHDGTAKGYWLADGFHRMLAAEKIGSVAISADIRSGTLRDAILFSVSANIKNSLQLTVADKRRAVTRMLTDEEWSKWADREIGRRCGTSHTFVATIRHELEAASPVYLATLPDRPEKPAPAPAPLKVDPTPAPAPRTVQRGSTTYQMTPPAKRTPVTDVTDHTRPTPLTVTGTADRPTGPNAALNAVLTWIKTVSPSQRMYALSNFKAPPYGASSAPYLKGIPDAAVRQAIKTVKDNPGLITLSAPTVAVAPAPESEPEPEPILDAAPAADLDVYDLREALISLFGLDSKVTNTDILIHVTMMANERDNARHELGRD